jgi:uncharacterized protein (TIGR03382 family)
MTAFTRIGLFTLGFVLWASLSLAFVPTGFRWELPVPYEVNTGSSQELGRDTTLQVITDSYANWSNPACSDFRSQMSGETNDLWDSRDRMNTLVWIYDAGQRPRELGGRSTIGVTLSVFQGAMAIDGDILFNGIDHSWTTNANQNGQVDAVSIITHELGHQLGLNHSPLQSATMYAAYLGGNGAASLSADDIDGVCNLYPSGAAPECQNDANCAMGERCVGGSCVEEGEVGGGAIGDPCGQNVSCDDGLFCVSDQSGNAFCTRQCQGACPEGWMCSDVTISGRRAQICLPGQAAGMSGDGEFGDPCGSNNDCIRGFCISDGQNTFCSQACGDDGDCPPGGECAAVRGGGGACIPGEAPVEPDMAVPPIPQDMSVGPPTPELPSMADQGVVPSQGELPETHGPDSGRPSASGPVIVRQIVPAEGCHCDAGGNGSPVSWVMAGLLLVGWRRRLAGPATANRR